MDCRIGNYLQYFNAHIDSMSFNKDNKSKSGILFSVPDTPSSYIIQLSKDVTDIFKEEDVVIDIDDDCIIVGDLHGHLQDLYRILTIFDLPPQTKYVFLGDLVDRGQFSIATVCLVLTLKILFPKSIYLIRGNHEFGQMSKDNGLFSEVLSAFQSTNPYNALFECFSYLPLAVIIKGEILCIHAGLSSGLSSVDQMRNLSRSILNYDDPIVCGLVWSDPREDTDIFQHSPRGTGFLFGQSHLNTFLAANGLKAIVRGHECAFEGIISMLEGKIVTVFSASNYCGDVRNKAGVLEIKGRKSIPHTFPALPCVLRESATFVQVFEKIETRRNFAHRSSYDAPALPVRPSMSDILSVPQKKKFHSAQIFRVHNEFDSIYSPLVFTSSSDFITMVRFKI